MSAAAQPTPAHPNSADHAHARIHLYRPQNQLGDLLLNVPAIRSIRERFPRAHVVLIVGSQNAAAVRGQPWADEIRVVDTRNFLGALRAGTPGAARAAFGGARPDLAVYFTTVSYSRSGAMLARWSLARERVGFDPAWYAERDRAALTRRIAYPAAREGQPPPHQSEVALTLARAVGAGAVPAPPHYIADPALAARAPKGAVYLHPGAGKLHNRWPAERFGAIARELLAAGRDVLWIEGPQDGDCVQTAAAALGRSLPIVRGETIPMLAARFARAALYVGNDTGPLHLAGGVGCPTVGVYGWTDPVEWLPVGRCVRSARAADHNLESILARDVLDVALPLLEGERCTVV